MNNGRTPETALMIRLAGMGIVLYWYYDIVKMYLQGGEEAPGMLFLILSGIVMVGGAVAVGIMAYRLYRRDKARQKEAAAQAALPLEEETREEEV